MSKLLPSNNLLREQDFAGFVDKSLMHDNSLITLDPMVCHSSLLEHIALGFDVSISNMSELEARRYLSNVCPVRDKRGTVRAVENALKVPFDDAKIMEWFEVEELDKGEFRVDVKIKTDTTKRYGTQRFNLAKKLVEASKNVRSSFAYFYVKLPTTLCNIEEYGGSVLNARLAKEIDPFEIETNTEIGGGNVLNARLAKEIEPFEIVDDMSIGGGVVWNI